jgi:hypothetical protein
VRELEAVAIENASEGCVRETFGAILAQWQATHAHDERVRATMRRIARDESRHAALAWEVAQWAERRLSADARKRVARAKQHAFDVLANELALDPPSELVDLLGLPSAAQAARLVRALERMLGFGPKPPGHP